jgi:seryl-tRNA synthetase
MLDIRFIRENADQVRKAVSDRNDTAPIDEILGVDTLRRERVGELDGLRQQRNIFSSPKHLKQAIELLNVCYPPEDIANLDDDARVERVKQRGRELRVKIQELEDEVRGLDARLNDLLLQVPNLPQDGVPIGRNDTENVQVRTWGESPKMDFTPKPHWDLGEALDIIDFERGVKISGSRFYVLKGSGARLQRAVITFMLDVHTREHGYTEIYPPSIVKKECMYGSAQLPKFEDNIYHDVEDDVWFVGTAEIPLTNLHRDEILNADQLPIRYCAYTPCYRREKMSAGKDTRGIKRGHQFDKVEMYKFTTPENSAAELESLTNDAEEVCRKLGLPYRVLEHCTGDLGFTAVKSYDIDVWAPGCGEWLEVSSCSNCGDFQARRTNIRYRPDKDAKPQYVHTLNGSGLALPRIIIGILENYQQADGRISVPEVLRPFMGTDSIG